MAEALDLLSENLADWFQNVDIRESTLVIDCRPFLTFNSGHILSSHNIHCPPIVKRRAAGSLPMENILRCSDTRSRLLNGGYKYVIVYDEDTTYLQNLTEDSNMYLVLRSLNEELRSPVYFLKGGYETFQSVYPFLCLSHISTESDSSDAANIEWSTPNGHPPEEMVPIVKSAGLRDTIKYRPSQDQGNPEAILPWLFLGSAYHAMQEPSLVNFGINALLNMASKSDTLTPGPSFLHKRMAVDDSCTSDIGSWFPEAIDFIESVRKEGGKVLVHCHAGISRSATVCIAYIMWYKNWTMEKAYDYLKSKRSLIAPNLNFMRQLIEFENQLEQNGRVGGSGCGGRLSSSTSTRSSSSSYMSAMSTCCECEVMNTLSGSNPNIDGVSMSTSNKQCQYCSMSSGSSDLSSPHQFDFDSATMGVAFNNNTAPAASSPFESSDMFQFNSRSTAAVSKTGFNFPTSQNLLPGLTKCHNSISRGGSSGIGGNFSNTFESVVMNKFNKDPLSSSAAARNAITSTLISQPPRSASANLFSSTGRACSPIVGLINGGGCDSSLDTLAAVPPPRPVSAKPVFNLPLTPCTQQANVFSFDSPICSPLSQHTNSPTLTLCHSPLVSPS